MRKEKEEIYEPIKNDYYYRTCKKCKSFLKLQWGNMGKMHLKLQELLMRQLPKYEEVFLFIGTQIFVFAMKMDLYDK